MRRVREEAVKWLREEAARRVGQADEQQAASRRQGDKYEEATRRLGQARRQAAHLSFTTVSLFHLTVPQWINILNDDLQNNA